MRRGKNTPERANYDGWKRLAAAVMVRAFQDAARPVPNNSTGRAKMHNARAWLAGDLQPYAQILDMDADMIHRLIEAEGYATLGARLKKGPGRQPWSTQ